MQLHRALTADWNNVPASQWNAWQRLAARTRGIITPGNSITLLGTCLVFGGLYLFTHDKLAAGILLIFVGRLADIADGLCAEYTKTKSTLGEAVDAAADKIIISVAILSLIAMHVLPLIVSIIILAHIIIGVILTSLAERYDMRLHPSRGGKIGAALIWLSIGLYLISFYLAQTHPGLGTIFEILAGFSFVGFIVLAGSSSFEYSRLVLRKIRRGK